MGVAVAMVACRQRPQYDSSALRDDFATRWPDQPTPSELDAQGEVLSLQVGDANVFVTSVDAPIPWSELEGPCATSILWPEAERLLRPHAGHAIVAVTADLDPVGLSTLLTRVTTSALATDPRALGVYWGNATLVVPKDMFIDFAAQVLPHGPPLYIWVDFRVGKNDAGSTSGFTTGLSELGHLELETETATDSVPELRDRFFNLAAYLLEHGPVIKDGHTVGETDDERIRVVYSKSAFGHEGTVMRLEYEPQR